MRQLLYYIAKTCIIHTSCYIGRIKCFLFQPGWVGCALAFLALGKVGFVSGVCVPCNVLKIAWGRAAKSCELEFE